MLRVPRDTTSEVNKLIEKMKENWMPLRWELLEAVKDKEQEDQEHNSPMKASQDKSTIVSPRLDFVGSSWEGSDTDESLENITLSPVLSFSNFVHYI